MTMNALGKTERYLSATEASDTPVIRFISTQLHCGLLARVVRQAHATSQDLAQVAGVANPIAAGVQMLQE
jgi:hypothetical protein